MFLDLQLDNSSQTRVSKLLLKIGVLGLTYKSLYLKRQIAVVEREETIWKSFA
jgi:hypothetical protein